MVRRKPFGVHPSGSLSVVASRILCQEANYTKKNTKICAFLLLDFSCYLWYNIITEREREVNEMKFVITFATLIEVEADSHEEAVDEAWELFKEGIEGDTDILSVDEEEEEE